MWVGIVRVNSAEIDIDCILRKNIVRLLVAMEMETEVNLDYSAIEALFSKNLPHLLEKIFFSLDYESYKRCLEVSVVWRNLLTSDSFKKRGKSVFCTEIDIQRCYLTDNL